MCILEFVKIKVSNVWCHRNICGILTKVHKVSVQGMYIVTSYNEKSFRALSSTKLFELCFYTYIYCFRFTFRPLTVLRIKSSMRNMK